MPSRQPAVESFVIDDNTKAVLLVGGLGTRLRSVVAYTPKALAVVGNEPFLNLLVRQLRRQGIRRLVMCTGYLGDQIENEFGDGHAWDVTIEYSKEMQPLGTAGAVKSAGRHLRNLSDFVVMNGDSFACVNFHQLFRFHRMHGGLVTMAVVQVGDAARYGTVRIGHAGRINGFEEKTGNHAPGLINAGLYVFSSEILNHIPDGPASLEKTVFPQLLDYGVFALKQEGIFIDIGTPEDYIRAQRLSDQLNSTFSS
jgi:D-glycero-alpha-D-manno-heptose 1-phosphate guanylyltransferase